MIAQARGRPTRESQPKEHIRDIPDFLILGSTGRVTTMWCAQRREKYQGCELELYCCISAASSQRHVVITVQIYNIMCECYPGFR